MNNVFCPNLLRRSLDFVVVCVQEIYNCSLSLFFINILERRAKIPSLASKSMRPYVCEIQTINVIEILI